MSTSQLVIEFHREIWANRCAKSRRHNAISGLGLLPREPALEVGSSHMSLSLSLYLSPRRDSLANLSQWHLLEESLFPNLNCT